MPVVFVVTKPFVGLSRYAPYEHSVPLLTFTFAFQWVPFSAGDDPKLILCYDKYRGEPPHRALVDFYVLTFLFPDDFYKQPVTSLEPLPRIKLSTDCTTLTASHMVSLQNLKRDEVDDTFYRMILSDQMHHIHEKYESAVCA